MPISKASLVQKRIDALAESTDSKKNLSRQFGTPAFLEAAKKIKDYMVAAGLETRIDAAKNVRGVLRSGNKNAKTFVVGSHFDTIENSGKYNGSLGILIAIEVAASLKRKEIQLPFNLEVIAFSDGEGVRFHSAHLGSKAVAGLFDEQMLFLEDDKGITLKELLTELKTDYQSIVKDQIPANKWLGYLDIHIEPGEQLYGKKLPVALAKSIYGHKRIDIRFTGEAAHTGSVPMDERKDALAAAAKFVLKVEGYAAKERNNVLATVGRLKVVNAAVNVIPATVNCSLDMRSLDGKRLNEAYEELYTICEKICHKRGIYFEWKLLEETSPVECDKNLNSLLAEAMRAAGTEPLSVVSGLATEATILSVVAPASLLFVRDFNGISYNPNEEVSVDDIQLAIDITEDFLQRLHV